MVDKQVKKFKWKIENFSSIRETKLYSDKFYVGGTKWQVLIFPKGSRKDQFSVYVVVADSATLPDGWRRHAQASFTVFNQINPEKSTTKVTLHDHEFSPEHPFWGFHSFLPLSELHDQTKGYLVNDACLFEVIVSTDRTLDLLSDKFLAENIIAEFIGKERDHGDPPIKRQKILMIKEKLQMSEATEEPTEEDMDAFFSCLESELASQDIDFPKEEAKQALARIGEALDMVPANFYEIGKFSPLEKSFEVLFSSDCSSALSKEQKAELLAMEENFKELPKRVVKAMKDKNPLAEKEIFKLNLICNLGKSLKIFKESKAELKQVEQRIFTLLQLLDEEQANKMKILAGCKENFKTTKDMKMELEALGKQWPQYEAKAKAAEEDAKTVSAEWIKMKDFISSLKEKI